MTRCYAGLICEEENHRYFTVEGNYPFGISIKSDLNTGWKATVCIMCYKGDSYIILNDGIEFEQLADCSQLSIRPKIVDLTVDYSTESEWAEFDFDGTNFTNGFED